MLSNPPKIQSISGSEIVWIDRQFQNNTPEICKLDQHIRDVRNNLFHGGKFNGVFEREISRNFKLLHSALIVLNEWLELDDDVKKLFFESLGV